MKEIILIKTGELALKGLNRGTFENILIKNLRRALHGLGELAVTKAQSAIYITPLSEEYDYEEADKRIQKVFGVAAYVRAAAAEKSMDDILAKTAVYIKEALQNANTFKVEAKRADKKFELTSPQICAITGEMLLNKYPHLNVDVNRPDVAVTVEIREQNAYIHAGQKKGAGGLPVGTGGNAAVLISGGIDSPVAAWMMAKRGIRLTAIHFASPPYTGERAQIKVYDLLDRLSAYCGIIPLFTVGFTEIQEQIDKNCPEDLSTVLARRFMMRIASAIAAEQGCGALITGESLGQVASQTLAALACTDDTARLPVLRPLIGLDKEEIIKISRKIGTYDISTLPYEDCCTVFTPKHPRTRPRLDFVRAAEAALDVAGLLEQVTPYIPH